MENTNPAPQETTFFITEYYLDEDQFQLKERKGRIFIRKNSSKDYPKIKAILDSSRENTSHSYNFDNGPEMHDQVIFNNPKKVEIPFQQ